jgi:putative photosynthetic complex assembly protein
VSALDEKPFPAGALIGAGFLILISVGGVAAIQVRKHIDPPPPAPVVAALESRTLRFVDEGDGINAYGGHVRVFDAATGEELPQLRPNDGFIRAVLNGLQFERTRAGVSGPPVFEVAYWPNKHITLADTATGKSVNVGEFGPGNMAVFLRFLPHGETKS